MKKTPVETRKEEWITKLDNGRVKIKLVPLDQWKSDLVITKTKSIAPKLNNLMLIMLNDPRLCGLVQLNDFAQRMEFA